MKSRIQRFVLYISFPFTLLALGCEGYIDTVDELIEAYEAARQTNPVAVAIAPESVEIGSDFILDGSKSTDPDGSVIDYEWQQTSGPEVELASDQLKPVVTAPDEPATLMFELRVFDDEGLESQPDTVEIEVYDPLEGNSQPVAVADAISTLVEINNLVTLNASSSDDDDGSIATYSWSQTSGETVTLSDTTIIQPTFTAPSTPQFLTFELTVTDNKGEASESDSVQIEIHDHASDVAAAKAALSFSDFTFAGSDTQTTVTDDFAAPVAGANSTTISWSSTKPAQLSFSGGSATITRLPWVNGDDPINFTATISKGAEVDTKGMQITILGKDRALYYVDATTEDIVRLSLTDVGDTEVIANGISNVSDLVFGSWPNYYLYWVDEVNDEINHVNTAGTGLGTLQSGLTNVQGLGFYYGSDQYTYFFYDNPGYGNVQTLAVDADGSLNSSFFGGTYGTSPNHLSMLTTADNNVVWVDTSSGQIIRSWEGPGESDTAFQYTPSGNVEAIAGNPSGSGRIFWVQNSPTFSIHWTDNQLGSHGSINITSPASFTIIDMQVDSRDGYLYMLIDNSGTKELRRVAYNGSGIATGVLDLLYSDLDATSFCFEF